MRWWTALSVSDKCFRGTPSPRAALTIATCGNEERRVRRNQSLHAAFSVGEQGGSTPSVDCATQVLCQLLHGAGSDQYRRDAFLRKHPP